VRYLQLKTWKFENFMDFVEIGLSGLVAVMTLFYLLQELVEIAFRRLGYFKSFWNLLELVIISLLGVTSYLKVKDTLKMQQLLADPISITSPKLQNLAFWVGQENNLLGIATLLLWYTLCRVFDFLCLSSSF
jgi:polycystin 2